MELVKGFKTHITRDSVLSPDIYYGNDSTGIYFQTDDDQFGRIKFYNMDAIKICRGEMIPYEYDWSRDEQRYWVFQIENSKWLAERYNYEKENYGYSYEFGGNVDDMLTDFNHYLFSFHDQFVEVIAKGIWFEKDSNSLLNKPLQVDHPFLNIPENEIKKFSAYDLTCQVRKNSKTREELIADAFYCPQKLLQFALEIEDSVFITNTLDLQYRNKKLISRFGGYFGKQVIEFPGIATLQDVKPYIEKYMKDVYNSRKEMGK
ncbi:hypothetical protein GJU43_08220 [Flavobacterium sp. LC2016-23]|uniref:hypothetical protein n=1 Tax=Flavobacterium sp. LC2016-23 TaxID=2666330 RepID=UPI0012B0EA9A|nr:hypothetical protein [Flavobacterium sp. LC2016-23]MRX39256.1 hypothetical protein [Flavobacterium sp. LC2016-23]